MEIERLRKHKVTLGSFLNQAPNFDSYISSNDKQEFIKETIDSLNLKKKYKVLEAAAGTGVCSRLIAPFVSSVTALDISIDMLQKGKEIAKYEKIENINFVESSIIEMPFDDESFDIVFTRLSLHHFTYVKETLSELKRVLKKDGKIVIIDIVAASKSEREINDKLERLRDPSHINKLTSLEIKNLLEVLEFDIIKIDHDSFEMNLDKWLALTKSPLSVRTIIESFLRSEIQGGISTGFEPFLKGETIYFKQNWMCLMGTK